VAPLTGKFHFFIDYFCALWKEELNRCAVVLSSASSDSQDNPLPLHIQSGLFIVSC